MTSLYLLLWIVGGILLQLTIYLSIGFWHHWVDYQTLRNSALDGGLPVQPSTFIDEPDSLVPGWSGLRTFMVTHKAVEDATQDICSFHLVPQDGHAMPPFLPGQFLTFRLDAPSPTGDTEPVIRCYSISDAPRPTGFRVSIKRAPAPANSQFPPGRSSNFFHDQVQVGSLLQVRAPSGHFHINRSDAPVVLIGGGIGITPMLSMLNWCLTEQPGRELWLFYGVRQGLKLMAQPHLEALAALHPNFHLHICLSNPGPQDVLGQNHQQQGRVNVELLRGLLPLKPYHFYICGPTAMLESLVPALEDWGVPDARIHFEAFGPASIKRKKSALTATSTLTTRASGAADATVIVTFSKTGKQLPWQAGSGTLLELAEANGIAVNSGCRAGGCASCQTTINTGEVAYQNAPDFDPEPGTCLLCVCTPKTDVTLDL
ncbi:MAG: 2Fe-2S iron-sulfur cluster binding domain-containing protein [Rhodoferax sp.]|uniref:2Fe-2S iron-sulfur cluster-binding protein n=1 Tax=Rhodoferax sp. TaxID=50421 RepID=UPI0014014704|nr:2Fe-2S iron-sulfur cluster-binding protein [Rhodoferax sp.]NDP40447.1 2Fe-2S iron-sulfur cluster binding domain-containing protein [Rhodoferax sp.]